MHVQRSKPRNSALGPVPTFGIAGIALVVVVACSSGGPTAITSVPPPSADPTPSPVATPTPTPTATPKPTPDLAMIGAAYLAAAERFNPILANSLAAYADPNNTGEDLAGISSDIALAFDQVIADFDAIDFPPEIEPDVAIMRAAFIAIRDAFELTSTLPSRDPLPVYEEQVAIYKAAADRVRAYLGLPPRATDPPK